MKEFGEWSDDALRGYVVMTRAFLEHSMHEDPRREEYLDRLERAERELATREAQPEKSGSIAFRGRPPDA